MTLPVDYLGRLTLENVLRCDLWSSRTRPVYRVMDDDELLFEKVGLRISSQLSETEEGG